MATVVHSPTVATTIAVVGAQVEGIGHPPLDPLESGRVVETSPLSQWTTIQQTNLPAVRAPPMRELPTTTDRYAACTQLGTFIHARTLRATRRESLGNKLHGDMDLIGPFGDYPDMTWIDSLRTPARMSAALCALSLTLSLPTTGCLIDGDGNDDDELSAPHDQDGESALNDDPMPAPDHPLAACSDGLTSAELANHLAIVDDFEASAHEMIACGALTANIATALTNGIMTLAEDPSGSMLPEQYTYEPDGTYTAAPAAFQDLRMHVRFFLAEDLPSIGQAGDQITANLFTMSSYLQGASTQVELVIDGWNSDVVVEIEHDGPGPLVELLGFGPNPPNPLRISQNELYTLQDGLRGLEMDMELIFADHPSVSTIEYSVQSPRMLVSSMLNKTPLDLDMVSAGGFRQDLEQDLTTQAWSLAYVDDVIGRLDGEVVFTVEGGDFDFEGTFSYLSSGWPTIELRCIE